MIKRQHIPTLEEAYSGTLYGDSGNTDRVVLIDPASLTEIDAQPFQVYNSDKLSELAASIRENGQLQPCVVRRLDDRMLVLAGRNRKRACELLGQKVKCVVIECSDADADLILTDTNLCQRQRLLPSELARGYAMQKRAYEAKGTRKSTAAVAEQAGEQIKTIQRYIKLASCVDDLLALVDAGRVPVMAGVLLSNLTEDEQHALASYMLTHETQELSLKQTELMLTLEDEWSDDNLSSFFAGKLVKPTAPASPAAPTDLSREPIPVSEPAAAANTTPANPSSQKTEPAAATEDGPQFKIEGYAVEQIIPATSTYDLSFCGDKIHAGDCFVAWLPGGWRAVKLEVRDSGAWPNWHIADPKLDAVCPIGLWCRVKKN